MQAAHNKILMQKFIALILLLTATAGYNFAQKFAYVDSEYILKNMPEYGVAKQQLDDVSKKWQKELEDKIAELDKERKDYEAEKVLLSEDMRIKKDEEFKTKQNAINELRKKRFGPTGDLYKKQQDLLKPIQDKVYAAIQEIADAKSYGIVFDKAGSTTIMYAGAKFDISDQVIRAMGYEPGKEDVEDAGLGGSSGGKGGIIDETKDKAKDILNSSSGGGSVPPRKP